MSSTDQATTEIAASAPMGAWVLHASRLHSCPTHRIGDRILVRPPSLHHAGQSCCLVPFLRLRSDLRKGTKGEVRCSWEGCRGVWTANRDDSSEEEGGWDPGQLEADLENKPFLLQLPQAVALALINAGVRQDHQPGDIVLANGQVNQELYLVVRGTLEVLEGDLRVASIGRGECFGELSILTHQAVSNSVRAAESCTLVAIPRDRFYELLSRFGSLGTLLNRLLARRLRASNQQLEQILRPGIWGNLEVFSFLSVVQSIQAGAMTGILTITRARGRAIFGFDTGRLRHAQVGGIVGEDALLEILRWTNGVFRFQNEPLQLAPNIHGETMAVLLDALRRFDESQLGEATRDGSETHLESGRGDSLSDTQTWLLPSTIEDASEPDTLSDDATSEFEIQIPGDPPEPT
ncbi:MAG: cyclic nucleotide-binding domain-containing protein [Fibrobacteria bacterium]|nr:cyclic nucleotide-binding domain-containing protein [Fibrobacteria bacterium]